MQFLRKCTCLQTKSKIQPGLEVGLAGEPLVAEPAPVGLSWAQPKETRLGPLSHGLITYGKGQKGQMQCELGGSQR